VALTVTVYAPVVRMVWHRTPGPEAAATPDPAATGREAPVDPLAATRP